VNSNIRFFIEEINFTYRNKRKTRKWLTNVIREEKNSPLDINYIFCNDEYLSELNKRFLHHSTFTDILTFPDLSLPQKIAGDIYISIERVKENAEKYSQLVDNELARVMVHGVLHLLGYKDKTLKDKEIMTCKEDYYLEKMKLF
jgi:probable rRNA maturation factor